MSVFLTFLGLFIVLPIVALVAIGVVIFLSYMVLTLLFWVLEVLVSAWVD